MPFIYRLEDKKNHYGPWENPHFDGLYSTELGACYDNPAYPSTLEDFSEDIDIYNYPLYRIGVHLPCLLFYWFGFDLDIFTRYAFYKIKVSKFIIGKSGKQASYLVADVIGEEILIDVATLLNKNITM
jgi:hypothetical protein